MRLFCQDESRIGLQLPTPRRLTGFDIKPRQMINPLYKYYWLYGAVEPATGENFWLEILRLDAPCFETYLRGFAQAYPASLNVMVLDKAPAHVARSVVVPENVVLYLAALQSGAESD